jgi:hypothetical protein
MPSGDAEEIKIKSSRWRHPKTIITKYACGHELTKVEYKGWTGLEIGLRSVYRSRNIRDMKKTALFYDVGFCPKCFELNIKAKRKESG